MSLEFFRKEKLKSEREKKYEQLEKSLGKRETLQQQCRKLFDEEYAIDNKYPVDAWFKDRKFDSTRSFYTNQEDKDTYEKIERELKGLKNERDKFDKEILETQFDLGLDAAGESMAKPQAWRITNDHTIKLGNKDILYTKEWETILGNELATIEMSAEPKTSMNEFLRTTAEAMGDQEALEQLKDWPKERDIPYQQITLKFRINQKAALLKRKNRDAAGSFLVTKRFGVEKKKDKYSVSFGSDFNAYAFPEISKERQARAINFMLQFAEQNGVEFFNE